ncbi:MAG TPA: hypothetical protein VIM11_27270 [Tepidisphaeraceae bacterium]|jgi:hypothetical protein
MARPLVDQTAVDDVRSVRENVARTHAGELQSHIDECNRIAEALLEQLNVRSTSAPNPDPTQSGPREVESDDTA